MINGGILMYNGSPSPIMVVSGKTAQEILKRSQRSDIDYTDAVNKAKERLRKVGGQLNKENILISR